MSQNVTWNGTSRSIPDAGNVNWPSLTGFLLDLGNNAAVAKQMKQAIRICTTSPVTVSPTSDCTIVTLLTVPAACAVNLPAGVNGQLFIVVDGTGDALTNNITVTPNGSETIQGAANFVMDHNRQVTIFQYSTTGTRWYVVANVIYPGTITPADIVGIIPASKGGTGVNNNDAATLTRSGNHDLAITTTGASAVTMPTTGTLATLAGTEALTNKTLTGNKIVSFLNGDDETITAPTHEGTLATLDGVETLENKVLSGNVIEDFDNGLGDTIETPPHAGTLATVAGAETLSNKTIASPTVTGTLLLQNAAGAQPVLALSEDPDNGTNKVQIQAAATMAADYTMTLPNAQGLSGQTMVNDGSGNLSWGAAGGSGQLNLIDNPNDATNWSETGTVFDGSPTTTTTAGDLPLSGIVDTAIKITASGNGTESTNYVSYSFTTPASMSGMLGIYLYMRAGTGFAASEWTVSVYQGTTRQNLTTDSSSVSYIQNIANQYGTAFFANASTAYTLRFARVSGSGSATLNVTDVQVTPGIRAQGGFIGDWTSYTPASYNGLGTPTSVGVYWRRNGTTIDIRGSFNAGTVSASEARVALPTGVTTGAQIVDASPYGSYFINKGTADKKGGAVLIEASKTYINFGAFGTFGTTAVNALAKANGDAVVESSDPIRFFAFGIPVSGWEGNGNLAQNNVEFMSSSFSSFSAVYGPAGTALPTTTPAGTYEEVTTASSPWISPQQVTGTVWIEIQEAGTATWQRVPSSQIAQLSYDGTNYIGLGVYSTGAGGFAIIRGKYRNGGSATWASMSAGTRYRVVKASAGVPVGFGEVQQNSGGLVKSAGQLLGTNTNDNAASGYVGEVLSTTGSLGAGTGRRQVLTLTLTPGDWDMWGVALIFSISGGTLSRIETGVNTTNATVTTDMKLGGYSSAGTTSTTNCSYPTGLRRVQVAAGTTQAIYLMVEVSNGSVTYSVDGGLYARRMR